MTELEFEDWYRQFRDDCTAIGRDRVTLIAECILPREHIANLPTIAPQYGIFRLDRFDESRPPGLRFVAVSRAILTVAAEYRTCTCPQYRTAAFCVHVANVDNHQRRHAEELIPAGRKGGVH